MSKLPMPIGATKLALGTVQFGLPYGISNARGQTKHEEAKVMVDLARASNIDTLDTAIAYGEAETVLGHIGVADFKIVSKVPPILEHVNAADDWVVGQVELSLSRLGVSRLHGLMLHSPNDLLGPHGYKIARGLLRAKDSGMVERIGLSVYSPEQLAATIHLMPIDIIQIPFNVFDRRFADAGWLDRLAMDGVEIHARSVFLQGLLLMPIEQLPSKFAPFKDMIKSWHDWLGAEAEAGRTPVQTCLAHVASYLEIARIVIGADNPVQLREIIAATKSNICRLPASFSSRETTLINPVEWNAL